MTGASHTWLQLQQLFQRVALAAIVLFAATVIGLTLAAAVGLAPWLSISASFGEVQLPNAGTYAQIALAVLALGLCFYLPSNTRILDLEKSHRNFEISMHDVARAYHMAHQADRDEVFTLSAEFDAVRERILHLRDHPELSDLEPAAQMSRESHDLAKIYSEDKVSRARTFLKQRTQELETYRERIAMAQKTVQEIKHWSQQISVEESVVAAQMKALESDLADVLPLIGYEMADGTEPENVVPLPKPQPEKSAEV